MNQVAITEIALAVPNICGQVRTPSEYRETRARRHTLHCVILVKCVYVVMSYFVQLGSSLVRQ